MKGRNQTFITRAIKHSKSQVKETCARSVVALAITSPSATTTLNAHLTDYSWLAKE